MNGVWLYREGAPGRSPDGVDLSGRRVDVRVDLSAGAAGATVWTNDLTTAYVHANSAYST